MTTDLDTSVLTTFPNLDAGFWETFWVVTLLGVCAGLVVAIVVDFNAPSGRKLPTLKSQRAVGVIALLSILAGGGAAMLNTVIAQNDYRASVCTTLEDAYLIELRECDELNVPTSAPSPDTIAFFGKTDATVPDLEGSGSQVINVTLVWDGSMLLLAATDDLQ